MKILQSPTELSSMRLSSYEKACSVFVFLAGGITDCPPWQDKVIKKLEELEGIFDLSKLIIINPRRQEWDMEDPNAIVEQIKWEHKYLKKCDIVSYFFSNSESLQPITLYELGKWANKKSSVVTVEKGYKREKDVYIQTALDGLCCGVYKEGDAIEQHARTIAYVAANVAKSKRR